MRLHEFTHRRLAEDSVRDGLSDMGIGPPLDWRGQVMRLGWEEFVIVLPPGERVDGRERISLSRLAQPHWVTFGAATGLRDVIASACATAGFVHRAAAETSQVETAARLAGAGMAPALVPENIVRDGLAATIVGADPPVRRELTAYTRTEWGLLERAFVGLMRETTWQ